MTYEEEYKEELNFLQKKQILETVFDSNDGNVRLAELLREYALEWYSEHDQGNYGRPDY